MTVEELHSKGFSAKEISGTLGTGMKIQNVWRIARLKGLKFKGSGSNVPSRKVRHNPFEAMTEECQYWLGVIASDGWLSTKFNTIGLGLNDQLHIVKYRDFVSKDLTIHEGGNQKKRHTVIFSDPDTKQWLISKGITPKKSLTMQLSSELFTSHFVRGVFDGDGHFSSRKSNQHKITSGSLEFLNQLSVFFKQHNIEHIIAVQCKAKNTTYAISIYNRESEKLYNLLYSNATVWLERKEQTLRLVVERRRRKSDELLGKPEEANQQPSLELNAL